VGTDVVERTLPFLSPQVAAIVRVQLATGMRPSEVLTMRPCDIDRSQDTWVYKPAKHKTQHLGFEKQVPLGPRARAAIEPFLDREPDAYLFSPAEAEKWRNDERANTRNPNRKTPIYPSELTARNKRREAAKRRKRKRPFAAKYSASSYRQAIEYGIKKANRAGVKLETWFPYQLRHTHGTEVRRKFGLEAAQVALGHATADVTQIYAERNMELATRVAVSMG
jgi:integrase